MLNIYVTAKREAGYNATRFLAMLNDHGGVKKAHILLEAPTVSEGTRHSGNANGWILPSRQSYSTTSASTLSFLTSN